MIFQLIIKNQYKQRVKTSRNYIFLNQDRLVTFELILCGTVILCLMFGPKVYILLSYEPIFVEYPAAASILKKYRGARSFDLTSNYKTNPFPTGGTHSVDYGASTNSFEAEDVYSNKPLPVFKPNALLSILKNSGSSENLNVFLIIFQCIGTLSVTSRFLN